MSSAVSFAEHSCWNGEDFRYVRRPVYFRLFSVGPGLGRPFEVDLQADYGIWYHRDNEELIELLRRHVPEVDWSRLYYHRDWVSQCSIDVVEPETDVLVARLEVRQSRCLVDEVEVGSNVVRMADWKVQHRSEGELLLTEDMIL